MRMQWSQRLVPAIRQLKDFERLMDMEYRYLILLEAHLGHVKQLVAYARKRGKELLLHADLIAGLKPDEAAAVFLAQQVKPAGIISTRKQVVQAARKHGVLGIQRIFLLDSMALETSFQLLEHAHPDCVEVLPGVIPRAIRRIAERAKVPVFAGGLIETEEDVERALAAGATAVTTSNREMWEAYRHRAFGT